MDVPRAFHARLPGQEREDRHHHRGVHGEDGGGQEPLHNAHDPTGDVVYPTQPAVLRGQLLEVDQRLRKRDRWREEEADQQHCRANPDEDAPASRGGSVLHQRGPDDVPGVRRCPASPRLRPPRGPLLGLYGGGQRRERHERARGGTQRLVGGPGLLDLRPQLIAPGREMRDGLHPAPDRQPHHRPADRRRAGVGAPGGRGQGALKAPPRGRVLAEGLVVVRAHVPHRVYAVDPAGKQPFEVRPDRLHGAAALRDAPHEDGGVPPAAGSPILCQPDVHDLLEASVEEDQH
mmetsp:Transcript_56365/g.152017  ORF Transcript_56365/g.152017 Transcript_56365/m.152017 type:complete len:290 (+) Transcript_56365:1165-2034(+)